MVRTALVLLILSAISTFAPTVASAACDPGQVLAARQAIRLSCDCSGAASRSAYLACARSVIGTEIAQGRLAGSCRSELKRFASTSTCGRPAAIACCVQANDRPWRGTIRRAAEACRAPRNGSSCVSPLPHLADACRADTGCNDAVCGNGTVEPENGEECELPGTASCDALCSIVSVCGNGVIEPDEECDGQAYCNETCAFPRSRCCQTGDGCLGDESGGPGLIRICFETMGELSWSTCEGEAGSCSEMPPLRACTVGSCVDRPIDPVPLCCQQSDGTCRDTIATTAGAIGEFGCGPTYPPSSEVNHLMAGSCGTNGRCDPAD